MYSLFLSLISLPPLLSLSAYAAHQPYDVRKIIDAFRQSHDDLVILCAHRGLRWNGTAENSRDAYFRASEAGIECIETDIHLSSDGYLPMIHDSGLGRETDVGEQSGKAAYNPFTGQGYNPKVSDVPFKGFIEKLHLRDEGGRVRDETVPSLPDMIESIHESGMNVVLQLDFKDKEAVEPAYWQLKNLTNAAGVPANEWCIYKLQATWYRTPEQFDALPWVQDAFASGVQLAFIPVYNPIDEVHFDTMASLNAFAETNYTISAEIELYSPNGPLQSIQNRIDELKSAKDNGAMSRFQTSGIFYAPGDFVMPISEKFFDPANYSLPEDLQVNGSVYVYQDNKAPKLLDSLVGNSSVDGHDHRSDFSWILSTGFDWIITDTPDEWDSRLQSQGRRNIKYMIADGKEEPDQKLASGWYRRRHARDITP